MVKCLDLLFLCTFNNTDKTVSTSSAVTIVLVGFLVLETYTVVLGSIFYLHSSVLLEGRVGFPLRCHMKFFIAFKAEMSVIVDTKLRCGRFLARLTSLHISIRHAQLNRDFAVYLVAKLAVVLAVNGVLVLVYSFFFRTVTFQVN